MFPFGHIAIVLPLIKKIGLKYMPILAFFAILPDIDMLLPFLEHSGFTHSLLFLTMLGITTFPVKLHKYAIMGVTFHMFVDSLTDRGIMLLYPLRDIYNFGLVSLNSYILAFNNDIIYVYLSRDIEWFAFTLCTLYFLVSYYRKRPRYRTIGIIAILVFLTSGTMFYTNIKTYDELPPVLQFKTGEVLREYNLHDKEIELVSPYVEGDWVKFYDGGEEYLELSYLVQENGEYGLELLSRGIPSSSLIILVDNRVYKTRITSEDYEWNKLGAYTLKKGVHNFKIKQYDTREHDSNVQIKKVRVLKLS